MRCKAYEVDMFEETKSKFIHWKMQFYERKAKKIHNKYKKYAQRCETREKELDELETEYGKERAWQEKYIKSKAYWAICIGVFMLLFTMCLSYMCDVSDWKTDTKMLCEALITILNSVFSIIIGIGISTLVLDFFSYIKYTRERIKEIMIDKEYLDTLSLKEKKNIIDICEKSIYFKDGKLTDNSLYANIKESIVPLIEENYYKQYKMHIDCYIDERKKQIIKKVHRIMEIECADETVGFEIPFSTYLTVVDGEVNDNTYSLKECSLDGKDLTKEVKRRINHAEVDRSEDVENVKFSINYKFNLKKGLNRIEIKTETRVPLDDNTYSHTITIPCKRYSVNFTVHNHNYDVQGFAFAFDDEKHRDIIDRVIYRDKYDECFKIRFENWTLPGEGTVFVINKKNSDKLKKM